MPKQPKFFILEGLLRETGKFEFIAGYESSVALRERRTNGNEIGLEVVLRDGNSCDLASSKPDVRFPAGCTGGPSRVGEGLLIAAIADRENAEQVAVVVGDQVLFSAPIGKTLPRIKKPTVKLTSKNKLRVRTAFGRHQPESIRVFVEAADGDVFPQLPMKPRETFTVDLSPYAGLGKARIKIQASTAFRTNTVRSQPFELPVARVTGQILAPLDEAIVEFGEHQSLAANLSDQNGRAVEWDSETVRWMVDGNVQHTTAQMALCPQLEAGTHQISLVRKRAGRRPEQLDAIEITVKPETEGMKVYREAVERFRMHKAVANDCGCGSRQSRFLADPQ